MRGVGQHLTPDQRARLAAELAALEGPGRAGIVDAIRVARAHGDLSENFEYHAAKNEQGLLERRITILRSRLKSAVIVEGGASGEVSVGSHVVVEDGDGERLRLLKASKPRRSRRRLARVPARVRAARQARR